MNFKNVSKNNNWKYSHIKKISFVKKILAFIKTKIENLFQIQIIKKKNLDLNSESASYLFSKNLHHYKTNTLIDVIKDFLIKLKIKNNLNNLERIIYNHDKIFFFQNPIKNNIGGIGYNNSLFLYTFLNYIRPNLTIESGVWQGYTSYLIDSSYSKIINLKFDIDYSKIIYRSKNGIYYNKDITECNLIEYKNKFSNCIAFFDDHVNQYKRFLYASKIGIPFIIFDDDISFSSINSDGWPAFPTINMCINSTKLGNNKSIKWVFQKRVASAKINIDLIKFKKNIKNYLYIQAPNISNITGYYHQPTMSFLAKKCIKKK